MAPIHEGHIKVKHAGVAESSKDMNELKEITVDWNEK